MHKHNVKDLAKTLCHLAKNTTDVAERRQRIDQLIRLCEVSLGREASNAQTLRISGPEFTRWYQTVQEKR